MLRVSADRSDSNWFRGRRVLVLGGTGFLGQQLVSALSALAADITVLANSRPLPENMADLSRTGCATIRVHHGDVRDLSLLSGLVAEQEVIYALAGRSGAVQSNTDPSLDLHVNCQGLLNLLESCRVNNPYARIVFPSSRLVYGRTKTLPVRETFSTKPTSIYGVHKLTCEHYLAVYHHLYGLPTVALRITNPYGSEYQSVQYTHGIINEFFRKAYQGQRLTVFGDGRQLRDYVHIDDVTQAFLMAGEVESAVGQVLNVGSGQGVPLGEVAERIAELVGAVSVDYLPWPRDASLVETGSFVADTERTRRVLGWAPRTALQNGLARMKRIP
jgi:UDP-glucose 4-epimerase